MEDKTENSYGPQAAVQILHPNPMGGAIPRWADPVSLAVLLYFRDCEDEVRGDRHEGLATLRPKDGLVVNNLTQKKTFTLPGAAFESSAKEEEIFVFCASRSLTDELRERFGAIACVEIADIAAFCARIQYALPAPVVFPGPRGRTRIGHRVQYYDDTE